MLNSNGPRYKRSSLEKKMNGDIMWCVAILLVLCFIGSVGSYKWLSEFTVPYDKIPFLGAEKPPNLVSMLSIFCVFIIILQVRMRAPVFI